MMEKIDLGMSVMDAIIIMSEGNPGGLRVLMDILNRKPDLMNPVTDIDSVPGFMMILNLDDMNIRGSDIWVAYKDFAKEDLLTFMKAIKERNKDMIKAVEMYCEHDVKPVQSGGSRDR